MRQVSEHQVWSQLKLSHAGTSPDPFAISSTASIDLSRPCTVLGGRNGSGKSRLLRSIWAKDEGNSLYLDLHHLCEQALMVLRDQANLSEMKDELGDIGPASDRLNDVKRIVGRDYESVAWFALDVGPEDPRVVERFRWDGDEPLTPYFVVTYAGIEYDATQMGLGEFSVHLLLWILEQYRDREGLVLLLDEPDAFLPPIGVEALLSRLLSICQKRGWRMIVSTHSEEMISSAVEHDSFLFLRMGEGGETEGFHSQADRSVAETLLASPAIERVLFVEDESAWYLCRALLNRGDRGLSRSTSLMWGSGVGDLAKLRKHIPRPPSPEIGFAVVPDGDQRTAMSEEPILKKWPLHFLPSDGDPDHLYRSLKEDPVLLAKSLGVDRGELQRRLDDLEGVNDHDWVNALGDAYGRSHALTVLAGCWADQHLVDATNFSASVRTAM